MNDDSHATDATPGEDESDLILDYLTTREMRNATELESIAQSYDTHVFRARRKKRGADWLTEKYLLQVHNDMFGVIWRWAGKFRRINLNLGVLWHMIPEQVRLLQDDFHYWDMSESSMPTLEIAARLQNRLTRIHPFKNGNGRHARLITDIFLYSRDHPLPVWPQIQLMDQEDDIRAQYISAMKKADMEDYRDLIAFIQDYISE